MLKALSSRIRNRYRSAGKIIVLSAVVLLGVSALLASDLFSSISTNIRIYNNVVRNVLTEYVDEIESEELITMSIEGMLDNLDPYTVFIREEDQSAVTMLTESKYGGVGIRLGMRNDILTVIAPMEGTPANRAGVRPGDKIIMIDSMATKEFKIDEAADHIRGKPGTTVTLTFRRIGVDEEFSINLVREEIQISDLPYNGVIDGVGYIRLTRFSRNSANDFKAALKDLGSNDIEGLIIDLRDNPGGLLPIAIEMVDALVKPGMKIVETRGRTKKAMRSHLSQNEPLIRSDLPLVVLVNGGSASASEIVAGAIQDLDRGAIVGQKTFGKGLVQTIYPLGKMTSIKMTTAKYYIPSGRLIQKEDYLDNGVLTDGLDKKDSLFVTLNGREMHGGGGITPDIEIEVDELSSLGRYLWGNGIFFEFATENREKYGLDKAVTVTDDIVNDFKSFIQSKDIELSFPGEKKFREFETGLAELEGFEGKVDFDELEAYFSQKHANAVTEAGDELHEGLALEFAALADGLGGRIRAALDHDEGFAKAMELIKDNLAYSMLLQGGEETASK
ncbi:S41 family peptidase [Candidatus Neomarinimicrobiota bacterium]